MGLVKTVVLVFGALAAILVSGAAAGDEAFERALSLATEKRYPEAREVLDPLLEREPDHPRARVLHGVLRAREGRVGEAIEIFEVLRRDHPDMIEPYNNLAVLYAVEGRLEDARRILLATLERRPDAVAYANLGDVYTRLARHAYERASELEAAAGGSPEPETDTAFATADPPGASRETGSRMEETQSRQSVAEPGDDAPEPAVTASQRRDSATESQDAAPESPDSVTTPPAAATDTPAPGIGIESARGAASESFAAAPEAASATDGFCARAGGFRSRRSVAEAALWLQSFGAEVLEVRHEESRHARSYRVYLPPFESRRQAVARLREIRNRGVRDVAVIPDGDLANGISFGIYRSAENLNRRIAALDRLGYSVRSQAAELEVVEEYVIKARASGMPTTLDAAWASQFPERSIRVVDCG